MAAPFPVLLSPLPCPSHGHGPSSVPICVPVTSPAPTSSCPCPHPWPPPSPPCPGHTHPYPQLHPVCVPILSPSPSHPNLMCGLCPQPARCCRTQGRWPGCRDAWRWPSGCCCAGRSVRGCWPGWGHGGAQGVGYCGVPWGGGCHGVPWVCRGCWGALEGGRQRLWGHRSAIGALRDGRHGMLGIWGFVRSGFPRRLR